MYACRHFCFWMTQSCHHIFHCSHELTSAMKPERLCRWSHGLAGQLRQLMDLMDLMDLMVSLEKLYIDDWLVVYLPLWKMMEFVNGKDYPIYEMENKIKGPDNPTSQLLPIMSFKGCSGVGEGRKDKGGGERLCVKVCEKIVCMYVRTYVCLYVHTYVRMYVCKYVCMNVCMCMCVTKLRVKDGVCESDVCF